MLALGLFLSPIIVHVLGEISNQDMLYYSVVVMLFAFLYSLPMTLIHMLVCIAIKIANKTKKDTSD
jgi:hypothetical protein